MKHKLLLPFEVKILQGRVYIFRDLSGNGNHRLAGREVLSINGMDIKAILRIMTEAMHGDGNIPTMRAIEVGRAFKELLFTQHQMRGDFKIALRNPKSNKIEQLQITRQESGVLKQIWVNQYPQDQDSNHFLNLSFFERGKIAYLKIVNFQVKDEGKEGGAILKETFEKIHDQGSHTLVLDLRDNGGGEDALGKVLFSHLVDHFFSYYDALTIKTDKYTVDQYVEEPIQLKAKWLSARPDGQFNFLKHPNLGIQQKSCACSRPWRHA